MAAGGHGHDFDDELRARSPSASQRTRVVIFSSKDASAVDSAIPLPPSPLLPNFSVDGPSSDGDGTSQLSTTRLSDHLQLMSQSGAARP